MFNEGLKRSERGQDVVVGATQPQSSPQVDRLLAKLESIPPLRVQGQDVIDVAAIIKRRPQVVLIDGLAYDNPPGSRNPKRYNDVEQLLTAGISVLTTVNLQYVDEFRDQVASITGKRVSQSIPRKFLEQADEIVVV